MVTLTDFECTLLLRKAYITSGVVRTFMEYEPTAELVLTVMEILVEEVEKIPLETLLEMFTNDAATFDNKELTHERYT